MKTIAMLIRLKQPITRKMLANRLNMSYATLHRRMKDVPELEVNSQDMLTSEQVTLFFQHYQYSPVVLEDIATIYEIP